MVERFMCSTVLYHGKCIRKIPGSTAVAHPSSLWAVLLHTWLRVSSLLFIFLTREHTHLVLQWTGHAGLPGDARPPLLCSFLGDSELNELP